MHILVALLFFAIGLSALAAAHYLPDSEGFAIAVFFAFGGVVTLVSGATRLIFPNNDLLRLAANVWLAIVGIYDVIFLRAFTRNGQRDRQDKLLIAQFVFIFAATGACFGLQAFAS